MKPHSITGCGFFIQAEYVVEQGRALLSEGFGQVAELPHAGGGDVLDLGVVSVVQGDGTGVDEVDRDSVADVADQAGGGVDGQRCADDQQYVALRDHFGGFFYHGHRLAEPDDVRTQLLSPAVLVSEVYVVVADIVYWLKEVLAAGLGNLPVQVDDVGGAGSLVQIVDVLGDDRTGYCSQSPPESLNVLIPLSLLTPAPESTASLFMVLLFFIVLEIESLQPKPEDGVDDPRSVLSVDMDDLLFGQGLLDAVYIGGGVETVTLNHFRGAGLGDAVEDRSQEIQLIPAQIVHGLLKPD